MAAQAFSFCSNLWSTSCSSSSPFQQQHHNPQTQFLKPNSVSFQQRKRLKPSSSSSLSLSTSPSYSNSFPLLLSNPNPNPNPNSFNTNPFIPLQIQQTHYNNNNPFLSCNNQTSFTDTNPSYLFPTDPPYSPQALAPLHYHSLDFLLDDVVPDPMLDFSSPEDQMLLAPFLSDPPPVPRQDHVRELETVSHLHCHDQRKQKPGGGAPAAGATVSQQSIAARERRRKITERTSELGKLIPGGNKMSTAEMFQSAYKYVKFLQAQVSVLQHLASSNQDMNEERAYAKELQVLASPIVQEKLYSEEKCLVTKEFLDRTQSMNQMAQSNSV